MPEQPEISLDNLQDLAAEAIAKKDPSGWFEPLYANAVWDTARVPWAKNKAHPYLEEWLQTYPPQAEGKSALVIGCGLGDDAEILASVGYRVTAFDISPSAIAWCKQRFPESTVNYLVADLFALDPAWQYQFDLVFECRTIQALPLEVRSPAIKAIADTVSENGTLVVITRHRDKDTIPDGPPWALSEDELGQFIAWGLSEVRCDRYVEGEPKIVQYRLEYRR